MIGKIPALLGIWPVSADASATTGVKEAQADKKAYKGNRKSLPKRHYQNYFGGFVYGTPTNRFRSLFMNLFAELDTNIDSPTESDHNGVPSLASVIRI